MPLYIAKTSSGKKINIDNASSSSSSNKTKKVVNQGALFIQRDPSGKSISLDKTGVVSRSYSELSEKEKQDLRKKDSANVTPMKSTVVRGNVTFIDPRTGEKTIVKAGSQYTPKSDVAKEKTAGEIIKEMRASGKTGLVESYQAVAPTVKSSMYSGGRLPTNPAEYPKDETVTISKEVKSSPEKFTTPEGMISEAKTPVWRQQFGDYKTLITEQNEMSKLAFPNVFERTAFNIARVGVKKASAFLGYVQETSRKEQIRQQYKSTGWLETAGTMLKAGGSETGLAVVGTAEMITHPETVATSVVSTGTELATTGQLLSVGEGLRTAPGTAILGIVGAGFGAEFAIGKTTQLARAGKLGKTATRGAKFFEASSVPTTFELAEMMAGERAVSSSKIAVVEKTRIAREVGTEKGLVDVEFGGVVQKGKNVDFYYGKGVGEVETKFDFPSTRGYADIDVAVVKLPKDYSFTEKGKVMNVKTGSVIEPDSFSMNIKARSRASQTFDTSFEGITKRGFEQEVNILTKKAGEKSDLFIGKQYSVIGEEFLGGDVIFEGGANVIVTDKSLFKSISEARVKGQDVFEIPKQKSGKFTKELPSGDVFGTGRIVDPESFVMLEASEMSKSRGKNLGTVTTDFGTYDVFSKESLTVNEKLFKDMSKAEKKGKKEVLEVTRISADSEQMKFLDSKLVETKQKLQRKVIERAKSDNILKIGYEETGGGRQKNIILQEGKQKARVKQKGAFEVPETRQAFRELIERDVDISARSKARPRIKTTRLAGLGLGLGSMSFGLSQSLRQGAGQKSTLFSKQDLFQRGLFKQDLKVLSVQDTRLVSTFETTQPTITNTVLSPVVPQFGVPLTPILPPSIGGLGGAGRNKRGGIARGKRTYAPSIGGIYGFEVVGLKALKSTPKGLQSGVNIRLPVSMRGKKYFEI